MCHSWDVWPFPERLVPEGQTELFEFGALPGDMINPDERDAKEATAGLIELLDVFRR